MGLSVEEFTLVAPCLDRQKFDVDRFPGAQGAMELVARLPVEVLLISYPLPDMVLPPFLQAVRKGPCRHSPLVLLAGGDSLNEAHRYIGRGANRVISLDSPKRELPATVSRLLNVAPRKTLRAFAQLRFKFDDTNWIPCRPENLSAPGLLLETDQRPPRGTQVDFELILPAIERPVVGRAEVAVTRWSAGSGCGAWACASSPSTATRSATKRPS